MKRKNFTAVITALLMAILIAPFTANAAEKPDNRVTEWKEYRAALDRMAEIDPYGLHAFKNDAERDEYWALYAKAEPLVGKYICVKTEAGELIMTPEEARACQKGDKTCLTNVMIANGLAVDPGASEEPEEPIKNGYTAAEVFGFAGNAINDVYQKASAVAPNGSTVDIEDIRNFVLDRINYGGHNTWKETTWIAYIESWNPVYTLEDGTKTDLNGALANAERIEEEKRQETGLPFPDLPIIPGINEPENKDLENTEEKPADAADADKKNDGKTPTKDDKTPVDPTKPDNGKTSSEAAAEEETAKKAAAEAAAKAEAEKKAQEEAARKAAAEAAAKAEAEKKAQEEAAKRAEEEAKKAAEEAAKNPGLDEETMRGLALDRAIKQACTLDTYSSLTPVVTGSNGDYGVEFYDGSTMYICYYITVNPDGTTTYRGTNYTLG